MIEPWLNRQIHSDPQKAMLAEIDDWRSAFARRLAPRIAAAEVRESSTTASTGEPIKSVVLLDTALNVGTKLYAYSIPTPYLSKDQIGMRVNYKRMLDEAARNSRSSVSRFMLAELQRLIGDMGHRFYAGDIGAVDEFLQLFCVAPEARKSFLAGSPETSAAEILEVVGARR